MAATRHELELETTAAKQRLEQAREREDELGAELAEHELNRSLEALSGVLRAERRRTTKGPRRAPASSEA